MTLSSGPLAGWSSHTAEQAVGPADGREPAHDMRMAAEPLDAIDGPPLGDEWAADPMGVAAAADHADCMVTSMPRSEEAQERFAVERWVNEGGCDAPSRAPKREAPVRSTGRRALRPRVLIVGAGVAGLETLLALRELADDRVDVSLLAPGLTFVNRSMSASRPFDAPRVRDLRLRDVARDLGARWLPATLDRVEPAQHHVVTSDGDRVAYDRLVLAVGARPARAWQVDGVLTLGGGHDGALNGYPVLLHQLRRGQVMRLAFVRPAGATWPSLLYDLALLTAADCASRGLSDVQLSLVTPESEPLAIFGTTVSDAIRRLLDDRAITLHTGSRGVPRGHGWLDIFPGGGIPFDRVVSQPLLIGPRLRGIPCGGEGFIHTDAHGRVAGVDDVFAAGDATTFAVKQGGLAAQQADAVAEMIALSVGIAIDPKPFAPVLRTVLLTGGAPRYLHADISGASEDSIISETALWSPPNKLSARYLAPYLSSHIANGATVTAQREHASGGLPEHAAAHRRHALAHLSERSAR
jgi:sulfide:quinone oxidoreductase